MSRWRGYLRWRRSCCSRWSRTKRPELPLKRRRRTACSTPEEEDEEEGEFVETSGGEKQIRKERESCSRRKEGKVKERDPETGLCNCEKIGRAHV